MNLSKRLQLIADKVPKCDVLADIGTDHGYLPIELIKNGIARKAYAMDINKGPLEKARKNIASAKEDGKVITILSNGLDKMPDDTNVVVIAGMGGMLISKILEANKRKLKGLEALIVSPHLDETNLRMKLHELGFAIESETMVLDQGKYYPVIQCKRGQEKYTPIEYTYGKYLMKRKDKVWMDYMILKEGEQRRLLNRLESQNNTDLRGRINEVENTLNTMNGVMRDD